MSGGVAVIEVGAATETEMKDKKLRIPLFEGYNGSYYIEKRG